MVLTGEKGDTMPGYINSDDRELIGNALGIPLLRDRIMAMTGTITEHEVIEIAKELYDSYQRVFESDKNQWTEIRKNITGKCGNQVISVSACKRKLKWLINYYNTKEGGENN